MSKDNIIVAVIGLCGAGKTDATQVFLDNDFKRVYFGDVTFDEMKRRDLPITPDNERMVREELRKTGDLAIYAKKIAPKIKELYDAGHNIVLESLYAWSEYKYLKEIYGDKLLLLAIVTDTAIRKERLAVRSFRPLTAEEVDVRDYAQIEKLEQGGPIAKADHFILNNTTREYLTGEVQKYIDSLTK